jgi:hypothetical protein
MCTPWRDSVYAATPLSIFYACYGSFIFTEIFCAHNGILFDNVFTIHFRFKTSLQNVMSKREKPRWQIIDHFFTKAIQCTHKPDDPDKQCTVDEDASSEESSNDEH